jgi:hypothetical protein
MPLNDRGISDYCDYNCIYVYISAPKLDHHVLGEKDAYVKFTSASTPFTHNAYLANLF